MNIFTRLKYIRKKLGFTLREVEKVTGLSNPIICQIENGKIKNPGFFTIEKLAIAYDVSLDDLSAPKNNTKLQNVCSCFPKPWTKIVNGNRVCKSCLAVSGPEQR